MKGHFLFQLQIGCEITQKERLGENCKSGQARIQGVTGRQVKFCPQGLSLSSTKCETLLLTGLATTPLAVRVSRNKCFNGEIAIFGGLRININNVAADDYC